MILIFMEIIYKNGYLFTIYSLTLRLDSDIKVSLTVIAQLIQLTA